MTDSLLVVLDDVIVGTLVRLQGGRLRFDYTEDTGTARSTPLSLSMPTQVRSHSDRIITSVAMGSPAGQRRRSGRWARQFHVSASSPFSLLRPQSGRTAPGPSASPRPTRSTACWHARRSYLAHRRRAW